MESSPAARRLIRGVRRQALVLTIAGFAALGVFGAFLQYLETDAARKRDAPPALRETSWLDRVNPFLPAALPGPTPRLAREYIYTGARLLAVEDAGAVAPAPADLAVWRPATGVWWIMGGESSPQTVEGWGMNGDVPAEGDYDGDGKTDFCVFRPSANQWWILKSSDGGFYSLPFGTSGDRPAAADFDGDGRTDPAVFRPSNGVWYIRRSSDGQTEQKTFGLGGDEPDPHDFDGDGRADPAVWRASNRTFYALTSLSGQLAAAVFTPASAVPAAADYDGDGRADFAVRSGADWIIRESASGRTVTVNWQQASDIAVPNDYDNDGKTDVAVWRPAGGLWLIRQSGSSGALRQAAWGTAGDIPVPAFYRR